MKIKIPCITVCTCKNKSVFSSLIIIHNYSLPFALWNVWWRINMLYLISIWIFFYVFHWYIFFWNFFIYLVEKWILSFWISMICCEWVIISCEFASFRGCVWVNFVIIYTYWYSTNFDFGWFSIHHSGQCFFTSVFVKKFLSILIDRVVVAF